MTQKVCLRLFCQEGDRHQGRLLNHHLVDMAREVGATGATVMRASAGFGRHGRHEDTFYELGGALPMVVETVLDQEQADHLLRRCGEESLHLFYTLTPVTTGITGL